MLVKELIEELQKCPQDMFIEVYSEETDITNKIKYISKEDTRYNLIYIIVT